LPAWLMIRFDHMHSKALHNGFAEDGLLYDVGALN